MILKNLLIVCLALFALSCSTAKKVSREDDKFAADFERASQALEGKDYSTAAMMFDQLRADNPTSETDFICLFNAAVAYENMKECQQAATRYRQVVQGAFKRYPRLQAQAHYNLGAVYECLGEDTKAMSSLLEARKLKGYLPQQIVWTEMPARLASYYAELGDRKTAMKYFDEASQGLKRVGAENSDSKKFAVKMAQILFLMGRLSDQDQEVKKNPIGSLRAIEFQQPFLLQAVEMDAEPWSKQAHLHLTTAYKNVSRWIHAANYEGVGVVQEALLQLRALKGLRFPKESERSKDLFTELEVEEKKWVSFLAKAAEINKLTPESQKREGLKRTYKAKSLKDHNSKSQKKE